MDHQGELEAKRKHDEDEFSEGIESQDVSEEIAAVPVSMEEDDDEKGEEAEGLLLEEQILEEKESDEDVSHSLDSMTECGKEEQETILVKEMDHQGELEAKRKHDEEEISEGIESPTKRINVNVESQDVSEEIEAVPVSMEEDDDEIDEEAEGLLLEEQILEEKESDEDVSYSLDSMTESDEEDDEEGDEEAEELLLEVPGEKRGGENISDFSDSEED